MARLLIMNHAGDHIDFPNLETRPQTLGDIKELIEEEGKGDQFDWDKLRVEVLMKDEEELRHVLENDNAALPKNFNLLMLGVNILHQKGAAEYSFPEGLSPDYELGDINEMSYKLARGTVKGLRSDVKDLKDKDLQEKLLEIIDGDKSYTHKTVDELKKSLRDFYKHFEVLEVPTPASATLPASFPALEALEERILRIEERLGFAPIEVYQAKAQPMLEEYEATK